MNTLSPIQLRHIIHQNPELMFEEFNTSKLLLDNLSKIEELKLHPHKPTGLIVEYTVNDGNYLMFRADIDALPIKEETGIEWSSTNNNMHACGHDVHTSILYGFIKKVVEQKINQNLIFIFQPGEEGGNGAKSIIDSGILKNFNIVNAFALHVTDEYELGTIASTPGILFAAAIEIDFTFHGKQAHVAFPDEGRNAIKAMRMLLDYAEDLVNQVKDPILFGYGKIYGGTARNIIPALAKAECTLRTLHVEELNGLINKFKNFTKHIEEKIGVTTEIKLNSPYTEVNVDKDLYNKCTDALIKEYRMIDCGYKMTAEDFGLFTKLFPSYMCWMGIAKGEKHGLHTPKFLPHDDVIDKGISIFMKILDKIGSGK